MSQRPHVARKRFGQHFLTDQFLIQQIVEAIDPKPGDRVVEIGPGLAALTQPLVERLGRLTVVELDRDLAARLRNHPLLQVIEADVLTVDFQQLTTSEQTGKEFDAMNKVSNGRLRIVGNLPYNISTPILFHLLDQVHVVKDQHFMLQKEVIDRMVARPATSEYGRLSIMLQWRYHMENVLYVPPESFDPPPKVDSAVVRMVPKAESPLQNHQVLEQLVQVAFSQRRKMLRNTLGPWLESKLFKGEFDLHRRAEEVPVDEFVSLAKAVQG